MKKERIVFALLALPMNISSAAQRSLEAEIFEEAKVNIGLGKQGALNKVLELPLQDHEDRLKELLLVAVYRDDGEHYVQQLTDVLEIQSHVASSGGMILRRSNSFHHSETLLPLDVAIMKGNVNNVRTLLKLNPDPSICRLLPGGDHIPVSVKRAVKALVKRKERGDSVYGGPKISADLEQLKEIYTLIEAYSKESKVTKSTSFRCLTTGFKRHDE